MDYSKFIRKRMINLGVRYQDASRCSRWYIQQLKNMGSERAIQQFKAVGDTILWYLYGSPERPAWVATKHRFPKALYFLKKYDEATLVRIAKFARAVRLNRLTEGQVKKVVTGAMRPYDGTSLGVDQLSYLVQAGLVVSGLRTADGQPTGPKQIARTFKRVQSVSGPTGTTLSPPVKESLDIAIRVPELYNLPYWKEAFWPLHPEWLEDYFERYVGPEGHAVGEIHAAQEGGGKLRMYASPYSIVQNLLYPIHYWIDQFRRVLPTDCTYDQKSGADWAQSLIAKGETVHSVDLSTATCRFPLSVQIRLMEKLGLEVPYLDALKWASQGDWKVGSELLPEFPEVLSWTVGQPLGIAPSMSMFSLTHNLLLVGCCHLLGLVPKDHFRVLGDDVVLKGEALLELYTQAVQAAGVPISWHKCHSSDRVAEFAGFTISGDIQLRPGQWRQAEKNNHLSLAEDLRTPLNGEVSPKWQAAQRLHLFMKGCYDPPINEWSKYIKLSSEMVALWEFEPPPAVSGLLWSVGVTRLLNREFELPHWAILPTEPNTFSEALSDGLPSTPSIDYWKHISRGSDLWVNIDTHVLWLWSGLSSAYTLGELSREEYRLVLDRLTANTHALYWQPPKSNPAGTGLHKRLLAAVSAV